jgi:hypothetical protein
LGTSLRYIEDLDHLSHDAICKINSYIVIVIVICEATLAAAAAAAADVGCVWKSSLCLLLL